MRFFCTLSLLLVLAGALPAETPLSDAQQKFAAELATIFQHAEKKNAAAVAGVDGWLFFAAELRLLSLGPFWGDDAVKVSRAHKPELADPMPAIFNFNEQLKARGIELLVVPVPPKAAIYPHKILPDVKISNGDTAPALKRFYDELRKAQIEVIDLTAALSESDDSNRLPAFCKTDSHWSGTGCYAAAQAIANVVRRKIGVPSARQEFQPEWKEVQINGDLVSLLPRDAPKPGPEKISIRTITEKGTSAAVVPDENSPLLLLGDSHTLVYHDFLAERAGLVDQLAMELGFAPDLIGTRGSGATPVRINLYRRSVKDAGYLAKKKVVVWCFAAREFTEATEGWAKAPVAK
jgi:hypothetical protein